MTDHPKHALPVGHAIGGYAIVRVIGQGGFGIVYEAYNSDTEQRVAIKEYYPSSIASRQDGTIVLNSERERDVFDKVLARYRSTALLQLKFDHPNILKIYDYIRAKNTGYMVTEFIDGEPMRAVLNRHGGRVPSYDIFRKMFEPMISALAYIHSRGYLHRDIAPDNIMWTKDGRPVLIDFGALKEDVGQDSRISSLVVVKEDYSPPEQQVPDKKRPMGFYTDIFALAGTMYAALAGHPPARAMARALTQGADLYSPMTEASRVKVPEEIYAAIDRALSLDITKRPKDLAEFTKLLGWDVKESRVEYPEKLAPEMNAPNLYDNQPAPLPHQSSGHSMALPPKQHKSRFALIASLCVAAVIAGSLLFYFSSREPSLPSQTQQTTQTPQVQPQLPPEKKEGESPADTERKLREAASEAERKTYESARGNIAALRAYLASCKECRFRNEASAEIESLEKALLAERESTEFSRARGSRERLQNYLTTCKICAHHEQAKTEIDAIKVEVADGRYVGTMEVVRAVPNNPSLPVNGCSPGEPRPIEFIVSGGSATFNINQHATPVELQGGALKYEGSRAVNIKGTSINQRLSLNVLFKEKEAAGEVSVTGPRGVCHFKVAAVFQSADVSTKLYFTGTNRIVREVPLNAGRPLQACKTGEVYGIAFNVEDGKITFGNREDLLQGVVKEDGSFRVEIVRQRTNQKGFAFKQHLLYVGKVLDTKVEGTFTGTGPLGSCFGVIEAARK